MNTVEEFKNLKPGDRLTSINPHWLDSTVIDSAGPKDRYYHIQASEICFRENGRDYDLGNSPHNCNSMRPERLAENFTIDKPEILTLEDFYIVVSDAYQTALDDLVEASVKLQLEMDRIKKIHYEASENVYGAREAILEHAKSSFKKDIKVIKFYHGEYNG